MVFKKITLVLLALAWFCVSWAQEFNGIPDTIVELHWKEDFNFEFSVTDGDPAIPVECSLYAEGDPTAIQVGTIYSTDDIYSDFLSGDDIGNYYSVYSYSDGQTTIIDTLHISRVNNAPEVYLPDIVEVNNTEDSLVVNFECYDDSLDVLNVLVYVDFRWRNGSSWTSRTEHAEVIIPDSSKMNEYQIVINFNNISSRTSCGIRVIASDTKESTEIYDQFNYWAPRNEFEGIPSDTIVHWDDSFIINLELVPQEGAVTYTGDVTVEAYHDDQLFNSYVLPTPVIGDKALRTFELSSFPDTGEYVYIFSLRDGQDVANNPRYMYDTLTVYSTNTVPELHDIPEAISHHWDSSYTLNFSVTDVDEHDSIVDNYVRVNLYRNGVLQNGWNINGPDVGSKSPRTIDLQPGDTGTYMYTFSYNDRKEEGWDTLIYTATNTVPEFHDIPATISHHWDSSYTLNFSVTDADEHDSIVDNYVRVNLYRDGVLQNGWNINGPNVGSKSPRTIDLQPGDTGTYMYTFSYNDRKEEGWDTLIYTATNTVPEFHDIPATISHHWDSSYTLNFSVSDADEHDSIVDNYVRVNLYRDGVLQNGWNINGPNLGSKSPRSIDLLPGDTGTYMYTFSYHDKKQEVWDTLIYTATNLVPEFHDIPETLSHHWSSTYTLDFSITDADEHDSIVDNYVRVNMYCDGVLQNGWNINGPNVGSKSLRSIDLLPGDTGTYMYTFSYYDGKEYALDTLLYSANNNASVFNGIPEVDSIIVGQQYSLEFTISDVDIQDSACENSVAVNQYYNGSLQQNFKIMGPDFGSKTKRVLQTPALNNSGTYVFVFSYSDGKLSTMDTLFLYVVDPTEITDQGVVENDKMPVGVFPIKNPVALSSNSLEFLVAIPKAIAVKSYIFDNLGNILDEQSVELFTNGKVHKMRWDMRNMNREFVCGGSYFVVVKARLADGSIKKYQTMIGIKE